MYEQKVEAHSPGGGGVLRCAALVMGCFFAHKKSSKWGASKSLKVPHFSYIGLKHGSLFPSG